MVPVLPELPNNLVLDIETTSKAPIEPLEAQNKFLSSSEVYGQPSRGCNRKTKLVRRSTSGSTPTLAQLMEPF